MDDDVDGLWFGAQVVPNDDEVGPSLSAVCGEQRYAVDFQMSAFPDALTGGLAGGVLRDFALGIGGSGVCGRRLGFGRRSSVGRGIGGRGIGRCGVGGCGLGWCSLWRRGLRRCGCIGKAVVSKGCCLRSGLRAARGGGAKCLNGSTIEATVRGQPDRLLKEAYCAASGRPEYTGHWNPETKSSQLRLNHSDHVRIGSTTDGGRHHGRLHERPQARPDAEPRGLSKGRSLPRETDAQTGRTSRVGSDPGDGVRGGGRGATTELLSEFRPVGDLGTTCEPGAWDDRGTAADAFRPAGEAAAAGGFVRIFCLQNRTRMIQVQMANCSSSSPLRRGPMLCNARAACSMSECVCLTVNTKLSPARCGTV